MKTRAKRVSDTVFFKHQCITNAQVTPKTLVIKAALDLTSALKGTVSCNGEMAEALEKFSKLLTKIAAAKSAMAKAKEQPDSLQTHPNARLAVPLPRVVNRPPIPASPLSRVPVAPAEADYCKRGLGERVQIVGMASQVAVLPMQFVESQYQVQTSENETPRRVTHGPPIGRPNYISHDNNEDNPPHWYNTRSGATSIMQ